MGHSICICAYVHVGQIRSLWVHVAHYHMMCAYVAERGRIGYYICNELRVIWPVPHEILSVITRSTIIT